MALWDFLEEPGVPPFPMSLSGRKEKRGKSSRESQSSGTQEHAGTDGNLGSLAMEKNREAKCRPTTLFLPQNYSRRPAFTGEENEAGKVTDLPAQVHTANEHKRHFLNLSLCGSKPC